MLKINNKNLTKNLLPENQLNSLWQSIEAADKESTFCQTLVNSGQLTNEQFFTVIKTHKIKELFIGFTIAKLDFLPLEDSKEFLLLFLGIKFEDIAKIEISKPILNLLPPDFEYNNKVLPLRITNKPSRKLQIAMANPKNLSLIEEIRFITDIVIEPVLANEIEIINKLNLYGYGVKPSVSAPAAQLSKIDLEKLAVKEDIIELVNNLFIKAVSSNASDIHIEPYERRIDIRHRIDGILYNQECMTIDYLPAIVSRIKIISELDIAERRLPQDGRIVTKIADKKFDLRVSIIPTLWGESIVMRLLNQSALTPDLYELGLNDENLQEMYKLTNSTSGIILITGPTGSGKTTTLYSTLKASGNLNKKIITIEDPIEYHLDNIMQMQIKNKIGLTFTGGLRAILRQDPDIIMLGEIRDLETAEIAIQSALTGHLVYSTLHTNDAVSSVTRLIDMNIPGYLISAALTAVLAQRLVRVLCWNCKEQHQPEEKQIAEFKYCHNFQQWANIKFFKPVGCKMCNNIGYNGRIGIFELLIIDDNIRNLIIKNKPASEFYNYLDSRNFVKFKEDGFNKVIKGVTSIEEILRITKIEINE